jgi:hypothetical protein
VIELSTIRPAVAALAVVAVSLAFPPTTAARGVPRWLVKAAVCGGAAYGGIEFAEVIARFDPARSTMPPDQFRRRVLAYKAGLALALCGIGARATGGIWNSLSRRGIEARESRLRDALADASPGVPYEYVDPANASLRGRFTAQPARVDADNGNRECRIVEDVLADRGREEQAFIKYCRDGNTWKDTHQ